MFLLLLLLLLLRRRRRRHHHWASLLRRRRCRCRCSRLLHRHRRVYPVLRPILLISPAVRARKEVRHAAACSRMPRSIFLRLNLATSSNLATRPRLLLRPRPQRRRTLLTSAARVRRAVMHHRHEPRARKRAARGCRGKNRAIRISVALSKPANSSASSPAKRSPKCGSAATWWAR